MLSPPSIWSLAFWKATAERSIATAAQSGLAYLGMGVINVLEVSWPAFGGIAAGGAVFSVLKSLAVNAVTKTGPSVTDAEHVNRPLSPITGPDSEEV